MKNIMLISSLLLVVGHIHTMDKKDPNDWLKKRREQCDKMVKIHEKMQKLHEEAQKIARVFPSIHKHFFFYKLAFNRDYVVHCKSKNLNEGQKVACEGYKRAASALTPKEAHAALGSIKLYNCTSEQCQKQLAAFSLELLKQTPKEMKNLQDSRDKLCDRAHLNEGEQVACEYLNKFKYFDEASEEVPTINQLCRAKSIADQKRCEIDCKRFMKQIFDSID